MLIAIVGTRCSGKSVVEDYFVNQGFISVHISGQEQNLGSGVPSSSLASLHPESISLAFENEADTNKTIDHLHPDPYLPPSIAKTKQTLELPSAQDLLQYITKNWQTNFVTVDIFTRPLVEIFVKRPFFMLLSVDAPLYERFLRLKSPSISIEDFVKDDDSLMFGAAESSMDVNSTSSHHNLNDLVNVRIINSFRNISNLYTHLDTLNILDPENLRPGWDSYFMTLASLASQRSNCMKRRVGAVLVRENRVLSTGYNGTPRGLPNCNEGGCPHCNRSSSSSTILYECVCLHAEENALLEAGRERIGKDAVLYCNTCPCLKCTVKIIQTGVKTVVYNLSYKVDDTSASLFQQAGVILRRYNPNNNFYLPAVNLPH